MAPISNAEKCRRYCEKHKVKYQKVDALRKKHQRVVMKKDPYINEIRLKIQREKKREYRERILKEKSQTNESFKSLASSSFSNNAVKGRSLKRACDALPKNPQQRSEIVQTLKKKFDLRINLSTKKPGRPGNELCDDEIDWLSEFMERPDITYTNPGRRDQRYIGKENGKSKFVPIRYLLWTLRNLLDMINGSSLVAQEKFDSFEEIFDKRLTFRQLYNFVKSRKYFVFNRDIPQASCLCEICENIVYLAKSIDAKLKSTPHQSNAHSLVETYSCDSSLESCMNSVCEGCHKSGLTIQDFTNEDDGVVFYKWKRIDNKIQKVEMSLSPREACKYFDEEIRILKRHIFVKRQQHAFYNSLKENMGVGELLMHVDYSESYVNTQQQEIQSAYFGHSTFSIFTACCYLRREDGKLVNENVTIVSEASDHSRIAAFTCINKVFNHIRDKHDLPLSVTLHIWSDGCAAQFRSRFVFRLLCDFSQSVKLCWYYNERHHGKGPMDGVGGTIKNLVYRDVMSNKCMIRNAEEFSDHVNKIATGITAIHLPKDELLTEPEDIGDSPKITETLSIHKLIRGFNEDNVCFIKFFKLANEVKPFHTQFYRKDGDPEVCGHEDLPLVFDVDQTCGFCKGKYEDKVEWLQCPICEQWFHETCFFEK